MIYSEIKRLCSMNKGEIHNWYWNMEEILMHNRNHFLEIWKNDVAGQNLIKYLQNRIQD